jgi:two-component system sensor kinase
VQEALTHVARHAGATLVVLGLHAESQGFVLRIADTGESPQRAAEPAGRQIARPVPHSRTRAHAGRHVGIQTAHGKGFVLSATIAAQTVQLHEMQTWHLCCAPQPTRSLSSAPPVRFTLM